MNQANESLVWFMVGITVKKMVWKERRSKMIKNLGVLGLLVVLSLCFMTQAYAVEITILTRLGEAVWVQPGLTGPGIDDNDGNGETIADLPEGDSAIAYKRGLSWYYAKITVDGVLGITALGLSYGPSIGDWRLTPDPFTVTDLPVTITIRTRPGESVWYQPALSGAGFDDLDGNGETIAELPEGDSAIAYKRAGAWYYAKITVDGVQGITALGLFYGPSIGDWRLDADLFTVTDLLVTITILTRFCEPVWYQPLLTGPGFDDTDGDGVTVAELPEGNSVIAYKRAGSWAYAKITVNGRYGITNLVMPWYSLWVGDWHVTSGLTASGTYILAEDADSDNDGYSVLDGDCNDCDPEVNPGVTEVCDGIDNNCDGIIPAGEVDADGDGYMVCGGDCNDNDARVNVPGNADTQALAADFIAQCKGATNRNDKNNHGQEVSCVAHLANALLDTGCINLEEHGKIVSTAAQTK